MKYEQNQWYVLLFVQGSSADRRDFSGTPEEDPVQRPNAPNPQRIPAILTLPRIPCFCSYGPVRPRPIDQSLWSVTEPANQRESLGLILLVWYGLMDFSRWSQDRLALMKRDLLLQETRDVGIWRVTVAVHYGSLIGSSHWRFIIIIIFIIMWDNFVIILYVSKQHK